MVETEKNDNGPVINHLTTEQSNLPDGTSSSELESDSGNKIILRSNAIKTCDTQEKLTDIDDTDSDSSTFHLNDNKSSDESLNLEIGPKKRLKRTVKKAYKCNFDGCLQLFRKKVHLIKHEFQHDGIKKFCCDVEGCDKTYKIKQHLQRHKRTFHDKVVIPKTVKCRAENCDKSFDSPFNMERHYRNVHENAKVYTCDVCSRSFRQKAQLRRHTVEHTGNYPYTCSDCGKNFTNKRTFTRHGCTERKYLCNECNLDFKNWSSLVSHRATHRVPFVCEICDRRFQCEWNLKNHRKCHQDKEDKNVIPCPHENCSRFYFHQKNLTAHIKQKHKNLKFACTYAGCPKVLSTKQKLDYHMRLHERPIDLGKPKIKAKRSRYHKKKKISSASQLANVILDPTVEKLLLQNKGDEIQIDQPDNVPLNMSISDVDGKDKSVLGCQLILSVQESAEENTTTHEPTK